VHTADRGTSIFWPQGPEYDTEDIREVIQRPYRIIYRIKDNQGDEVMEASSTATGRGTKTKLISAYMKDTAVELAFNVIVERDEEGYYIATVPELQGCHTQARSLDALMERITEAIDLCLEEQGRPVTTSQFLGIQRVTVKL
jgi:predicted RNase H-like HicB family nuclease